VTFYRDFAAAYGTCWLVMLIFSLVSQSHINTGAFGVFGFPVIGLIWAFVKLSMYKSEQDRDQMLDRRLRRLERDFRNNPEDSN
jgi:hypothetical protein